NDINSCNTIVTLDANEGISPAAGTTIVWYDSATGGSLVSNPVLNSFGTITYWAEAISGAGCVSSTRTSVTLTSTEVTAEVTGSYILTCATTSVVLDATGTSTGPIQDLNFSWTGPLGFVSTSEDPSINTPGVYTLTVTDNLSGCSDVASVAVAQDINPVTANITGGD